VCRVKSSKNDKPNVFVYRTALSFLTSGAAVHCSLAVQPFSVRKMYRNDITHIQESVIVSKAVKTCFTSLVAFGLETRTKSSTMWY